MRIHKVTHNNADGGRMGRSVIVPQASALELSTRSPEEIDRVSVTLSTRIPHPTDDQRSASFHLVLEDIDGMRRVRDYLVRACEVAELVSK